MTYLELQRKLEDNFYTGVTLSSEEVFGLYLLLRRLSIHDKQKQIPIPYWKIDD